MDFDSERIRNDFFNEIEQALNEIIKLKIEEPEEYQKNADE